MFNICLNSAANGQSVSDFQHHLKDIGDRVDMLDIHRFAGKHSDLKRDPFPLGSSKDATYFNIVLEISF